MCSPSYEITKSMTDTASVAVSVPWTDVISIGYNNGCVLKFNLFTVDFVIKSRPMHPESRSMFSIFPFSLVYGNCNFLSLLFFF